MSSATRNTALVSAIALTIGIAFASPDSPRWSPEQLATLRSLSLANLGPLPGDASNRFADDSRAASLGKALFFDTRLSANGKVSCATCHVPSKEFQDGTPLAHGVGTTGRRTMPIAGTAHSPWLFWDGRADSQWAQALGPLESAVEHGGSRAQYAHVIASNYRDEYEAVFGPLPRLDGIPMHAGPVADTSLNAAWRRLAPARQEDISRVYANIGKAIAAFERRIEFAPSRFDRYVEAELAGRAHTPESSLSNDEVQGLRLFIGKASCSNCHNGPRFTDDHFHNTGVPLPTTSAPFDSGRTIGVRQALAGEFNCTSRYSDAKPDDCAELRFATTEGEELVRAYKTPSLRGVAERAPYMHAGQISTLTDVIAHYDRAPNAPAGHSELKPLRLSASERRQIEAFLRTLSAPVEKSADTTEVVVSIGLSPSHNGRYSAEVVAAPPPAVGVGPSWTVRLTRRGQGLSGARLSVRPWAPDTGDASTMSTSVRYVGDGQYRVDGIFFPTPGWWNVPLVIDGAAGVDSLAFNVVMPTTPTKRW
jgi:cytochrome c peroxidase